MRRTGYIDARQEKLATEGRRTVAEALADFRAKMAAAGRDPKHVSSTIDYIEKVCSAADFGIIGAITADGVNAYAQDLGQRRSARTVQAYLTAIKGFTRWLAQDGKLPADPLASVRKPNPKADRRRERRMLLPEEWTWLRSVTLAEGVERFGIAAGERVLLYATAVQTGLRSSELRSLTRRRLFLEGDRPYITCAAGSTKNKRDARQYIQPELAVELRAHVATKAPATPVFAMPPKDDVATMLRTDLADARRKWLRAAETDPEDYQRREQSDFLTAVNQEGELFDFHALRHTCGAWLAMSGAHPKAVQAVMRHSTITLTMDCYGHLFPGQEAETVARLPAMLTDAPGVLAATGTDDSHAHPPDERGAHLGAHPEGKRRLGPAKRGEREWDQSTGRRGVGGRPQVLTLSRNTKSRRAVATAGEAAEGKGFEPSTPYGAPDFESTPELSKTRGFRDGGASGCAPETETGAADPDLAWLLTAWPDLPEDTRHRILSLIQEAVADTHGKASPQTPTQAERRARVRASDAQAVERHTDAGRHV